MRFQFVGFFFRHVDAGKYSAVIGAVVPIVKQADVPVRSNGIEKVQQCARSFRKFESKKALVLDARRPAADHVAHVQFRHFIVAEVFYGVTDVT